MGFTDEDWFGSFGSIGTAALLCSCLVLPIHCSRSTSKLWANAYELDIFRGFAWYSIGCKSLCSYRSWKMKVCRTLRVVVRSLFWKLRNANKVFLESFSARSTMVEDRTVLPAPGIPISQNRLVE